jgi:hypothetical protein
MTKANDIFGHGRRPTATGAIGRAGTANDPLGPVGRSIFGIVRESAGLVRHVAELGIVLMLDTDAPAPKPQAPAKPSAEKPLSAPDASNVTRFPTPRTTNHVKKGMSHDRRQ